MPAVDHILFARADDSGGSLGMYYFMNFFIWSWIGVSVGWGAVFLYYYAMYSWAVMQRRKKLEDHYSGRRDDQV